MVISKKIILINLSLITSVSLFNNNLAYSLIPNVYEPNIEELKSTGRKIGITAAQLLYFGETKKARSLIDLAIKLHPSDDYLWSILTDIEIESKNLIAAKDSLLQAKKINPNKALYWFKEGSIYFQENRIVESIKAIEKGLSIDPKNSGAYFQLGNSKLVIKKFNRALIAFEKATELEPNFWQAINNQALVLFEQGKKEKAIILWEKAIKIKNDPEPMLALAVANYENNNDKDNSIKIAKKALLENPNYVLAIHQKEQLWGEKLRKATANLFKDPKMSTSVTKALKQANLNKK